MPTSRRDWMTVCLALGCGLVLRAVIVHRYAIVAGDALVYSTLAINWLRHGMFALGDGAPLHPTLIRLPGYPAFLAVIFRVFGIGNFTAVFWTQIVIDLLICWLVFLFVRDRVSLRAAHIALWLAALCPFTATYVAAPLTETLSIFCVALGILAASRCLDQRFTRWPWLFALAFALGYAILLRPDGGLLAAAIIGWLCWHFSRSDPTRRFVFTRLAVVALLALLPLAPWTLRNWRLFHVFEPLAPRYANDPGELTESGYKSWTKTWFVDAASNEEFYWCADDCALDINLLPKRAFDSSDQRDRTADLLDDYNDSQTVSPALDSRFAALAAERNRAHPVRTHLLLPIARLADMWLRPRTELFPTPARWWEWRAHPRPSLFALVYAVLNAAYLALAIAAFIRRRVPLAGMLLAYVVLRCLLLLTLENAEPRYTLECFPIVIIAAACALAPKQRARQAINASD
jgi:hypothetical protein